MMLERALIEIAQGKRDGTLGGYFFTKKEAAKILEATYGIEVVVPGKVGSTNDEEMETTMVNVTKSILFMSLSFLATVAGFWLLNGIYAY